MGRRELRFFVVISTIVFGSFMASYFSKQGKAQLVDIDVGSSTTMVLGCEPIRKLDGEYWLPEKFESVAVYVDGKRCQRSDYIVNRSKRTITFLIETNDDSVVIVDYTPRS